MKVRAPLLVLSQYGDLQDLLLVLDQLLPDEDCDVRVVPTLVHVEDYNRFASLRRLYLI